MLVRRAHSAGGAGLNVGDVEGIAAGSEHAMVLGTDGSVWGWGDGTYGDLGDNSEYAEPRPVLAIGPGSGITQLATDTGDTVALLSGVTQIAAGGNTSQAVQTVFQLIQR